MRKKIKRAASLLNRKEETALVDRFWVCFEHPDEADKQGNPTA